MNRLIFYIISFALLSTACKPKKTVSKKAAQERQFYLDRIQNHNIQYEYYKAKATIKMKNKYEQISAKIYIRAKHQDTIWLMGKRLGIEGMRMLITKDSIFSINRLERYCQKGSYSDLKYEYGINLDFNTIQEALVGNITIEDPIDILHEEIDSAHFKLSYNVQSILFKHWLDLSSAHIQKSEITDELNRAVKMEFADYRQIENSPYQSSFFRSYEIPETELGDLYLQLDFSSIELDTETRMPFSIPSHYDEFKL